MHLVVYTALLVGLFLNQAAGVDAPAATSKNAKALRLNYVAMQTVENHFLPKNERKSIEELIRQLDRAKIQQQPKGLFVTLYKEGKTRACWGSINPEHTDLVAGTIHTTENALTKEYRFPQVKRGEVSEIKAQVTIINSLQPINSISELNPLRHGLMVRQDGRGAVLLPGEARDAHYMLVQTKLKAGIPVKSRCQMYRINADVIRN
ncbi:MAG: AMMECR1 domain-containing protein [Leptolyngbya sp.]|nr:AMMECR1 domain-containing protein [Candidatus Melainabacteria bacterium]